MRLRFLIGALAVGLFATACVSGGSASPSRSRARGSANLIVEPEIAAAGAETALKVIERLRPTMLQTRGNTIKVYLNGSLIGNTSMLTSIQAISIKQIEYLNGYDATTRFGTGHDAGVILVTSK